MSIQGWQEAIADLVARGGSPGAATLEPTPESALREGERRSLELARGSVGLGVTCDVQRFWRAQRLRSAAPFSLHALPEEDAESLLWRYIDENMAFTQFFFPEAIRFLSWLLAQPALNVHPHAGSVVAWELANLRAANAPSAPQEREGASLQRGPAASLVSFAAPPEALLGALLRGGPLPPVSEARWRFFVAPGQRLREATLAEIALWDRLGEEGLPLRALDDASEEQDAARALLAAAVLTLR